MSIMNNQKSRIPSFYKIAAVLPKATYCKIFLHELYRSMGNYHPKHIEAMLLTLSTLKQSDSVYFVLGVYGELMSLPNNPSKRNSFRYTDIKNKLKELASENYYYDPNALKCSDMNNPAALISTAAIEYLLGKDYKRRNKIADSIQLLFEKHLSKRCGCRFKLPAFKKPSVVRDFILWKLRKEHKATFFSKKQPLNMEITPAQIMRVFKYPTRLQGLADALCLQIKKSEAGDNVKLKR